MKRPLAFALATAAALVASIAPAQQNDRSRATETGMRIRIIAGDTVLGATLEDSAASRDFAALLPLDLTLSDYHGIEKIADLPTRLSTDGAPAGVDPEVGDITYYAPWGNLALFYRGFGYSRGLVRLGRIEQGIERLAGSGAITARIERVDGSR